MTKLQSICLLAALVGIGHADSPFRYRFCMYPIEIFRVGANMSRVKTQAQTAATTTQPSTPGRASTKTRTLKSKKIISKVRAD